MALAGCIDEGLACRAGRTWRPRRIGMETVTPGHCGRPSHRAPQSFRPSASASSFGISPQLTARGSSVGCGRDVGCPTGIVSGSFTQAVTRFSSVGRFALQASIILHTFKHRAGSGRRWLCHYTHPNRFRLFQNPGCAIFECLRVVCYPWPLHTVIQIVSG